MRTIQGDMDTIVCFDEKVWLQDRNIINFKHDGEYIQKVTLYAKRSSKSAYETIATYQCDENNECVIDVTDWLRIYQDTTAFMTECTKESETINIPLTIAGLINPADFIIPNNASVESLSSHGCKIMPPRMILADLGVATIFETYCTDYTNLTFKDTASHTLGRSNTLAVGTTSFSILENNVAITSRTPRTIFSDCKTSSIGSGYKYASVEWISASGATKRHTWCIGSAISSVGDTISLVTNDGSYNTIKGREDSFTLFLEGLNAYDTWYYSDICTSSEVKVSIDGGSTWRQVDVTTEGVTIPDGDAELNKIEVKVTYKDYDAFAM